MDYILFVESSYTGAGKLCIQWCIENNIKPVLATRDRNPYHFIAEFGKKLEVFDCDTRDISEIETFIHKQNVVPFFATTDDYSTEIVAELREKYKQSTPPSGRVSLCKNKNLMRIALNKVAPENSVKFVNITQFGIPEKFNFPAVVKPSSYTGSIGVKLCLDEFELIAHIKDNENLNPPGAFIKNEWILEEYIHGEEFSVEVLNNKILGITKKYKYELPYFVERGHIFPCKLDETISDHIQEQILFIMNRLELTIGIYHVEIILREDLVKIVEINARLPGDRIPQLIKNSIGIDIIDSYMKYIKCDPNTDLQKTKNLVSSIMYNPYGDTPLGGGIKCVESTHPSDPGRRGKVESNLDRDGFQIYVSDSFEKLSEMFEKSSVNYPVRIRPATNQDCKTIKELHFYGLIESGSLSIDNTLDEDLNDIEESYRDGTFYLAYLRDCPEYVVGMGALSKLNDIYYVKRMRVVASMRRSGIGNLIIRELIGYAKKQNIQELYLDTSTAQIGAQKLYENHGFIHIRNDVIGGVPSKIYKLTIK